MMDEVEMSLPEPEKPITYLDRYLRIISEELHQTNPVVCEVGISRGGFFVWWSRRLAIGHMVGIDQDISQVSDDVISSLETSDIPLSLCKSDQGDIDTIQDFIQGIFPDNPQPLSVVIDDASHIGVKSGMTYSTLFPLLKSGGIYVIEDWGTGFWDDYPDGSYAGSGMVALVKLFINDIGMRDATDPAHTKSHKQEESEIKEVRIFQGQVFVFKA